MASKAVFSASERLLLKRTMTRADEKDDHAAQGYLREGSALWLSAQTEEWPDEIVECIHTNLIAGKMRIGRIAIADLEADKSVGQFKSVLVMRSTRSRGSNG